VKGEGNQQDYGMRVYDPRLGKFLSVDPLTKGYPWYTPYQFAGNKPVGFIDIDGAEEGSPLLKFFVIDPILKPANDLWVAANFYHITPKSAEQIKNESLGKAVGVLKGANSTLSLGLYNPSWRQLGINEEYWDDADAGDLAFRIMPWSVGRNGGVSPRLSLSRNGQAVVNRAANLQLIKRSSILLANSAGNSEDGSNEDNTSTNGDNKSSDKLPRYEGPKPTYHVNPKHVKVRAGQNASKLPADAEDVYKRAVPDASANAKNWYGKNKSGVIYRYSNSNDGFAHFSGRSDEGDGIRNLTEYAKERLKKL